MQWRLYAGARPARPEPAGQQHRRPELSARPTSRRWPTTFAQHLDGLCEECQRRLEDQPAAPARREEAGVPGGARRARRTARTTCATRAARTSRRGSATSRARASRSRSTRAWCAGSTTTRARCGRSGHAASAPQSTIGGGGRYDGLAEQLGGRPTPGVGLASGRRAHHPRAEGPAGRRPVCERHRGVRRLPERAGKAGGVPARRRRCARRASRPTWRLATASWASSSGGRLEVRRAVRADPGRRRAGQPARVTVKDLRDGGDQRARGARRELAAGAASVHELATAESTRRLKRLDEARARADELAGELSDPATFGDARRAAELGREQGELSEVVERYRPYLSLVGRLERGRGDLCATAPTTTCRRSPRRKSAPSSRSSSRSSPACRSSCGRATRTTTAT